MEKPPDCYTNREASLLSMIGLLTVEGCEFCLGLGEVAVGRLVV